MRIVYMGTSTFAVPFLAALAKEHDVRLVITAPKRKRGRGKAPSLSPVGEKAQTLGLPTLQPEKVSEVKSALQNETFDFLVCVAYGKKVPNPLLDAARIESLNVHASLLPKLRGAAPITRAIESGEETTGLSIMRMVARMDAGPVFAQAEVAIEEKETKGSLEAKLLAIGPAFLIRTLPRIAAGTLTPSEQEEAEATHAEKIRPGEEIIDFARPASELERKIRAFAPQPGLRTTIKGRILKILEADLVAGSQARPGTLLSVTKKTALVATGEGALSLRKLQLAGKRPLEIHSFLNGAGRTLFAEGLVLGEDSPRDAAK